MCFSLINKYVDPETGFKFVHEQRLNTKIAICQIYVNVGSLIEDPKSKGIAHLVEHLMFKASTTKSTKEISELLERNGAIINAYTNFDVTCFHFTVLNENFYKCLDIYSDMIFNKNIPEDEFEREKQVVIQELCMYEDYPSALNEDNFYKKYYKWDYIIGYREILEKITLQDVYDFINKYYVPQNMTISIVSNKFYPFVKEKVKQYFLQRCHRCGLNAYSTFWNTLQPLQLDYDNKICKINKDITQVQVRVQYPISNLTSVIDLFPINHICKLCNIGLSSVLFREIREKYGLCYDVKAFNDNFMNETVSKMYPYALYVSSSMELQNVNKFMKKLDDIIHNLANLITESDVEKLRNYYKMQNITLTDRAEYNVLTFNQESPVKLDKIYKTLSKLSLEETKKLINYYLVPKKLKYKAMMLGNFNKNKPTKSKKKQGVR